MAVTLKEVLAKIRAASDTAENILSSFELAPLGSVDLLLSHSFLNRFWVLVFWNFLDDSSSQWEMGRAMTYQLTFFTLICILQT